MADPHVARDFLNAWLPHGLRSRIYFDLFVWLLVNR